MAHSLERYRKKVHKRLLGLQEVFARASIGDFSRDVEWYEEEDEFTECYVGVQIMLDVIRDQLEEVHALNAKLSFKVEQLENEMKRRENMEGRKDDFIAILGHELRNPLAPITYAAQLINLKLDSGDIPRTELREHASIIERQSTHMARLINDLLDMSRILRGRLDLKLATIDLSAVVLHAVETARPSIEEKNHTLTVSLPTEDIVLEADPLRLEQAIVNILNNAAKYTPPSGTISLAIERVQDQIAIRIKDSGIGISEGFIDKIFNIFSREDYSSDPTRGGLGIGLTVAQGIAQLHGGNVSVHSEGRNKGAELIIHLPAYQHASGSEKTIQPLPEYKPSPKNVPLPTRRILVVDDNQDHADTLSQVLVAYGQEVRTVYDGTAALQIIPAFKPHVVFLDLAMPRINGYEVVRQLKLQRIGATKIIALTGFGQQSDVAHTKAAGFDGHLVKPPKVQDLLDMLQ